jgi:hypothetical protein
MKDLPQGDVETQKSAILKIINGNDNLPIDLKDKLSADVNEVEDENKVPSLLSKINNEIDIIARGGAIIKSGDKVKVVDPKKVSEEYKKSYDEYKAARDKLKQAKTLEERRRAKEELEDKRAKRAECYKAVGEVVGAAADRVGQFGQSILTSDPDKFIESTLGASTDIIKLVGKGMAKGLLAVGAGYTSWRVNNKVEKEVDKELGDAKKFSAEITKPGVKFDSKSSDDSNYIPDEEEDNDEYNEISSKLSNYKSEVSKTNNEENFEDVGPIKSWDDAYKYGYAKLKQIHGDNYDETKAKETLDGLKSKYPNTPQSVIGALKFGRCRKSDKDKKSNSRLSNSDLLRYSVDKEFNNSDDLPKDSYLEDSSSKRYISIENDLGIDIPLSSLKSAKDLISYFNIPDFTADIEAKSKDNEDNNYLSAGYSNSGRFKLSEIKDINTMINSRQYDSHILFSSKNELLELKEIFPKLAKKLGESNLPFTIDWDNGFPIELDIYSSKFTKNYLDVLPEFYFTIEKDPRAKGQEFFMSSDNHNELGGGPYNENQASTIINQYMKNGLKGVSEYVKNWRLVTNDGVNYIHDNNDNSIGTNELMDSLIHPTNAFISYLGKGEFEVRRNYIDKDPEFTLTLVGPDNFTVLSRKHKNWSGTMISTDSVVKLLNAFYISNSEVDSLTSSLFSNSRISEVTHDRSYDKKNFIQDAVKFINIHNWKEILNDLTHNLGYNVSWDWSQFQSPQTFIDWASLNDNLVCDELFMVYDKVIKSMKTRSLNMDDDSTYQSNSVKPNLTLSPGESLTMTNLDNDDSVVFTNRDSVSYPKSLIKAYLIIVKPNSYDDVDFTDGKPYGNPRYILSTSDREFNEFMNWSNLMKNLNSRKNNSIMYFGRNNSRLDIPEFTDADCLNVYNASGADLKQPDRRKVATVRYALESDEIVNGDANALRNMMDFVKRSSNSGDVALVKAELASMILASNGESLNSRYSNSEKIEDWDQAAEFAKNRLKMIHGDNYDESKAQGMIDGLKKKYPDNPMVVMGAIRGTHSNSRYVNSSIYAGIANIGAVLVIDNSHREYSMFEVVDKSEPIGQIVSYVRNAYPQFTGHDLEVEPQVITIDRDRANLNYADYMKKVEAAIPVGYKSAVVGEDTSYDFTHTSFNYWNQSMNSRELDPGKTPDPKVCEGVVKLAREYAPKVKGPDWRKYTAEYLAKVGQNIPDITQYDFDAFYSYAVRHPEIYKDEVILALDCLSSQSGFPGDVRFMNSKAPDGARDITVIVDGKKYPGVKLWIEASKGSRNIWILPSKNLAKDMVKFVGGRFDGPAFGKEYVDMVSNSDAGRRLLVSDSGGTDKISTFMSNITDMIYTEFDNINTITTNMSVLTSHHGYIKSEDDFISQFKIKLN